MDDYPERCPRCDIDFWTVENADICPQCCDVVGQCPDCSKFTKDLILWTVYDGSEYKNSNICDSTMKRKYLRAKIREEPINSEDCFFRPPYSKDRPLLTSKIDDSTKWLLRCPECKILFTAYCG